MATYNNVQIHPIPSKPNEKPKITVNVTTSNITRSGDNVSVKVAVSINALKSPYYFGYSLILYAQLNNGSQVQLFSKPSGLWNGPYATWDANKYNGSATLTTSTTSSSATLKLFLKSNDDCLNNSTAQVWSTSISVPEPAAPKVTAKATSSSYTQISWSATSDIDISEWAYKLDGNKWMSYTGAAKSSSKTLGISEGQHTIQVGGKRASGQWGYSNTISYDCRKPSITSAILTIIDKNKGSLSFSCDFSCQVYFNGSYLTYAAGNTTIINEVNLKENSVYNNTIKIERVSNSSLQNSTTIQSDTRIPSITLEGRVDSNTLHIKATSAYYLKNWVLTFTPAPGYTAPVVTKTFSNSMTSLEYTTRDSDGLVTGVKYLVQVTATRADNNLSGASNIISLTPEGGTYIRTPEGYKFGEFYIYHDGKWKNVETVYIYTPSGWKECK